MPPPPGPPGDRPVPRVFQSYLEEGSHGVHHLQGTYGLGCAACNGGSGVLRGVPYRDRGVSGWIKGDGGGGFAAGGSPRGHWGHAGGHFQSHVCVPRLVPLSRSAAGPRETLGCPQTFPRAQALLGVVTMGKWGAQDDTGPHQPRAVPTLAHSGPVTKWGQSVLRGETGGLCYSPGPGRLRYSGGRLSPPPASKFPPNFPPWGSVLTLREVLAWPPPALPDLRPLFIWASNFFCAVIQFFCVCSTARSWKQ